MLFAVAFMYQDGIPRYDRVVFEEPNYKYYSGKDVVMLRPALNREVHEFVEVRLVLRLVDATSEAEAIAMATERFPYNVVSAMSLKIDEK
jgi:hypothetical protein